MGKNSVWMGILCAALILAGQNLWADIGTDPLGRRGTLAPTTASTSQSGRWWVFFRDKNVYSAAEVQMRAAEYLRTQLSGPRRARTGVHPDGKDLPVVGEYIDVVKAEGAEVYRVSRWLNAVSIYASASQLERIERLPMVAGIAPVAVGVSNERLSSERALSTGGAESMQAADYPFNYGLALQQNLQLNVPELHALGLTGTGVKIAVFDTGFRLTHNAFDSLLAEGRLIDKWDFVFADTSVADDSLDVGGQDRHGSMVLSVIVGDANGQLVGPALDAQVILAKTEDIASETPVEEDNYVAALEWADSLGADIITSSLSYNFGYVMDGTQGITSQAVSTAAERGILLCTAMGNSGPAAMTLGAPADAFGIVAVGAVDSFGSIAAFSSRGPTADGRTKPEVCARGVSVAVAEPTLAGSYTSVSGTSLSTPLTAASSSLLIQAHPDWTPWQVREALMQTGSNASAPDNTYGWGVIDVLAALDYHPFGALQLQQVGAADHYDSAPWDLAVIPLARTDRLPTEITLHYTYEGGASDSVAMANSGDTMWTASLPYTAARGLRYYYAVTDSALRTVTFPPAAPARQFELLRLPDSLTEGFEFGGLRWTRGGTGDLWWVSAAEAASGQFALNDSPRGSYPASANGSFAMNKPLILGSGSPMQVRFDTRYQLGTGDTGFVEIQKRPSAAWEPLAQLTGTASSWGPQSYTFAGSADDSLKVRFRLQSDAVTEGDGWYIDNVVISAMTTGISSREPVTPAAFELRANYPNPFNPATTIEFVLAAPTTVQLSVYNVNGQLVRRLSRGVLDAGLHRVSWDGTDNRGHEVASGVYFYRLRTDIQTMTRKMLLLR